MIIVLIKPTESAISLEQLNLEIGVVDMWVMADTLGSPSGERFNAVMSSRSAEFTKQVLWDSGYNIVSVLTPVNGDERDDLGEEDE